MVQLYVRDLQPPLERPIKELRGFQRITLEPGEVQRVSFTLPASAFAYYDTGAHAFVTHPGAYEVMVGSSSADIRQTTRVEVSSRGQWAP